MIFGVFVEMLKTEVSKRLDTSVFSILLILMGNVGNALLANLNISRIEAISAMLKT
jgi:NADH/NAD ratio-sensing transcriptional regulator Rex